MIPELTPSVGTEIKEWIRQAFEAYRKWMESNHKQVNG